MAGTDERGSTRSLVLRAIRAGGTVSRTELADATGLAGASITRIVRGLIDEGLVTEVGLAESRGGTPRRLLELDPAARYAAGVHLDRHGSHIVLTDLAGRVVARDDGAGFGPSPMETLVSLAERIADLVDSVGVPPERILGIGLGSYGPQDRRTRRIRSGYVDAEWQGTDVCGVLEHLTGLPVALENDALAVAVGELWSGGMPPTATYAVVYLAGGIGGGVVVGGRAYRGSSSNGVELGHITIDHAGALCTCGNRGCLDNIAGPHAVVERAIADTDLGERLGLTGTEASIATDFRLITDAAADGNRIAHELIEHSARAIATGAVTLANLFDLDSVVLAGPGYGRMLPVYRDAVADALDRSFFARALHVVTATASTSTTEAVAFGAAASVLESAFGPDDAADALVPFPRHRPITRPAYQELT
ncbi:ROK family transcriptional regulator [Agromyces larvae]|uniref:ROK family transcriptional regulator n=1 Tax=Agromyces larvae TaxID=2929802 RepID=A0ABY4BV00_9MICO|nr:ROK family transcriptional regulator [Agromyces larvae]UOE43047.1 ROK family transcriptional regulator [Agromyces larvae]